MTTSTLPIPSRPMIQRFVVIQGGLHTRTATTEEILGWLELNNLPADAMTDPTPRREHNRAWAFSKPVYVGGNLIDTDTGVGTNMLGVPLG